MDIMVVLRRNKVKTSCSIELEVIDIFSRLVTEPLPLPLEMLESTGMEEQKDHVYLLTRTYIHTCIHSCIHTYIHATIYIY